MSRFDMLERVSLFSDLDEDDIARLEAIALQRKVARNSVVIQEGDQTDSLYVMVQGKAHALRGDESGRQLIVNRFGPGDCFGEMSFFDRSVRCATVVTRTPCTLMVLPREPFFDFAARRPRIYWNVIRALLSKLRKATEQIEQLAFLDVYGRLTRVLIEHQDDQGMIAEKMTQQELADMVGTSRETVNRILGELFNGGYLSREKGFIRIRKKFPFSL